MKKMMWILTCILTFVLVFSGSAFLKLKFPTFSNPLHVDWSDSVGTIYTDLEYGKEELNKYDLYVPADHSKNHMVLSFIFTRADLQAEIKMTMPICLNILLLKAM